MVGNASSGDLLCIVNDLTGNETELEIVSLAGPFHQVGIISTRIVIFFVTRASRRTQLKIQPVGDLSLKVLLVNIGWFVSFKSAVENREKLYNTSWLELAWDNKTICWDPSQIYWDSSKLSTSTST